MAKPTCDSPQRECLRKYQDKTIDNLILDKAYGGYEAKVENGQVVFFKHWINKLAPKT